MCAENHTTSFLGFSREGLTLTRGHQRATVANVVMGIGTLLAEALEAAFKAHERWRQRRALLSLDDHLLKDIGISRADVEREITKPVWRD